MSTGRTGMIAELKKRRPPPHGGSQRQSVGARAYSMVPWAWK